MIGSGIFIVSAEMSRVLGSPGYLLLAWVVTGFITVLAALSYGELAAMMPLAGGQYVYLTRAYNHFVGFLYGWTVFTVIQTGVIAAVAVAFSKFTAVIFPYFSSENILFSAGFIHVSAAQLLAISMIIFLSYINSLGVRGGKLIQRIFTTAKIIALIGIIILGLYFGFSDHTTLAGNFSHFWNAAGASFMHGKLVNGTLNGTGLVSAIGVAMVGSLFSSDAWNNVTFIAGEIKTPKRNIPLSLFYGTLIVTVLYVLTNLAYLALLPLRGSPLAEDTFGRGMQFALNDRVGVAAAAMIFGNVAAFLMAILIMVSTFGCNNGLILSGARLYYAMAKDKLFFTKSASLNKKNVPSFALLLQAVWASVLCLSGTYGDLLDYATFASLLFYIITIAGIFILRKKLPDAERPYKVWGYPLTPVFYIIIALAICADLLVFKTRSTGMGLLIVITGIPAYFLYRRIGEVEKSDVA